MKHLIVTLGLVAGILAVFAFGGWLPDVQHSFKIAFYSVLALFILLMTGSLIAATLAHGETDES